MIDRTPAQPPLSGAQMRLIERMRTGQIVARADLEGVLDPDGEKESVDLARQIARLRRKGFVIRTHYGIGYQMTAGPVKIGPSYDDQVRDLRRVIVRAQRLFAEAAQRLGDMAEQLEPRGD